MFMGFIGLNSVMLEHAQATLTCRQVHAICLLITITSIWLHIQHGSHGRNGKGSNAAATWDRLKLGIYTSQNVYIILEGTPAQGARSMSGTYTPHAPSPLITA